MFKNARQWVIICSLVFACIFTAIWFTFGLVALLWVLATYFIMEMILPLNMSLSERLFYALGTFLTLGAILVMVRPWH